METSHIEIPARKASPIIIVREEEFNPQTVKQAEAAGYVVLVSHKMTTPPIIFVP
jgi:hypothetical protein